MLVLTRKAGEEIQIGSTITVKILQTSKGRIKLGIIAPPDVSLARGELLAKAAPPPRDLEPAGAR